MDAATCGGVPERGHAAHVVVIGDGEHRDADLDGFVDDGLRVRAGIPATGPAAECPCVAVGVHLKGAAMKDGARRERHRTSDRILGSHSFPP
jgi:hypothetical protein